MVARGTIPKPVRKPRKKAWTALTSTSHHQETRVKSQESLLLRSIEDYLMNRASPSPGSSCVPPVHLHIPEQRDFSEKPSKVAVLPSKVWQKELYKSLAFQLDLPSAHPEDVQVVIHGPRLSVLTQNETVAYRWAIDLGENVVSERLRCGLVDAQLRMLVSVMMPTDNDTEAQTFSIKNEWPW